MRPKSPEVQVARVRSVSGSTTIVDSRLIAVIGVSVSVSSRGAQRRGICTSPRSPEQLLLCWIVRGVHVREHEGAEAVDLDDRLTAGHGVVRVVRGDAREGVARKCFEVGLGE